MDVTITIGDHRIDVPHDAFEVLLGAWNQTIDTGDAFATLDAYTPDSIRKAREVSGLLHLAFRFELQQQRDARASA